MARRRSKGTGSKLKPIKNYRSEKYVLYIKNIETSLLLVSKADKDLTDRQVRDELNDLIEELSNVETVEALFDEEWEEEESFRINAENSTREMVLRQLETLFDDIGPLSPQDLIGVIKVILSSVKTWTTGGDKSRGYLNYIEGFLGQVGVHVGKL